MRRAVKAGRGWEMDKSWPRICFGVWTMVRFGMEGIGWMVGWWDGWLLRAEIRQRRSGSGSGGSGFEFG